MRVRKGIKILGKVMTIGLIIRTIMDLQTENSNLRAEKAGLEERVRRLMNDHDIDMMNLRDILKTYGVEGYLIRSGITKEELMRVRDILG